MGGKGLKMKNDVYEKIIDDLVNSGRGHMAISDLSKHMETYTTNVKTAMKEMVAERDACCKIIMDNNVLVKDKLKAIKKLYK